MKYLFLLINMAVSSIGMFAQKESIPIKEPPPSVITDPNRPRTPARMNVEAWLEDNVLTIYFYNPEGEASVWLESTEGYPLEETTFSTDTPIVVDLTPYDTVSSFTIKTEAGHTYTGYLL